MGLNFPAAPLVGEVYPTPALPGVPQYLWDGEVWNVKPQAVIVDSYSKAETDAKFVDVAGDTMSGQLVAPTLVATGEVWIHTGVLRMEPTGVQYLHNYGNELNVVGMNLRVQGGAVVQGDVTSYRPDTTGYFFPGNSNSRYYGWDGGSMIINGAGAQLYVTGNINCAADITAAGNFWTGATIYFRGNGGIYISNDGSNFNIVGTHVIAHSGLTSYADLTAAGNLWANSGTLYFRGNDGLHLTHDGTNYHLRGANFYTSNNIYTYGSFSFAGNMDASYALDGVPATRTIGAGAIITIIHNFSGMVVITNTLSGQTIVFLCGGGNVAVLGNSGGLNQVSGGGAAPENGYVFYNGTGGTANFGVIALRARDGR